MKNATPRPWVDKYSEISGSDGNMVAFMSYRDVDFRANAALIVRAVNSHDQLVEALERWNSNSAGFDNVQLERRFDPYTIKSIHMTRAALKLAKGEA